MHRALFLLLTSLLMTGVAIDGLSQNQSSPARGRIVVPPGSSVGLPGRAHSSLLVFVPEVGAKPLIPAGETPSSISCIYGLTPPTPGCPVNGVTLPTGGSHAIAVVVQGHYAALQSDLDTFDTQWGLPAITLQTICSAGGCPTTTNLDAPLEVEWAHAMAPNAQIIVVEWNTNPIADLAVDWAGQAVAAAGGGEVSNSWGYSGGEFPGELLLDPRFAVPSVVYLAEAGDAGPVPQYPSVSPNVISVGGTTVNRVAGAFTNETCWTPSGGGISTIEPLPSYQSNSSPAYPFWNITAPFRNTPDLSAVADPATGVAVYASLSPSCLGWCIVGGTGAATPIMAGIVNAGGNFYSSTNAELTNVYNKYMVITGGYTNYFNDITSGPPAVTGWDICTGIGTTQSPTAY